jgi:hypothetical protein
MAVLAVSSTVMAKPGEDNPVDQWVALTDKVNQIYDIVVGPGMVRMESDEGQYFVTGGAGTWSVMEVESDQVGHVTLTAAAHHFGAGDALFIRVSLPGLGSALMVLDGEGQAQTVEFAASTWALAVTSTGDAEAVYYAYTITYPTVE